MGLMDSVDPREAPSLQQDHSPTKAALERRQGRALKRKALFANAAGAASSPTKCPREGATGSQAISSSSQRSGSSHNSASDEAGSKEGRGARGLLVELLPSQHSTTEGLEPPMSRGGGEEEGDGGLLQACGGCGGAADNPALPPLVLVAELSEGLRSQLVPTPLEEMLERDRCLAGAVASCGLPEGALLLSCDPNSPYVARLRDVPLLAAPQPPPLARNYACTKAWRVGDGAAQGPELLLPSLFEFMTIPELELPRADAMEEQLRRDILALLWEPDLLQPCIWADVDRWHNMHTEFYAERQKVTWGKARQEQEDPQPPPANFVSMLLS